MRALVRIEPPPLLSMSLTFDSSDDLDSTLSSGSSIDDPLQGVGLSDPRLSQDRRRMLDVINDMHSKGYVNSCTICESMLKLLF
jgi:hypothetical protein